MIHSDAKSLIAQGDALFSKKRVLDSRNQEIADHFYPERADFTVQRDIGEDWADHLMTGYPSMVRRDLGNAIGSILRPRAQRWFHIGAADEAREDHASRRWLEWATGVQRRAMYDRVTQFTRATKEADHDFVTFGSPILSVDINRRDNALLYRCWHLRDVAWCEDETGQIGEVHRNWRPTRRQLVALFGDQTHPKVREDLEGRGGETVRVRHVVIRADRYDRKKMRQPWCSLFVDLDNQHIMEEVGSWTRRYVIPRWMTISGSQYAYSPATLIALPDARLFQQMTLTLLEAGEKATNPPMVGVSEAIRGDMDLRAGGFTAVDAQYDERLGEVLRPLAVDRRGLPFGLEMADRMTQMLREAFYLNTLSLPPATTGDMTATEVGQRVQEYIRQAMPLFEPLEHEYNGALCEMTFETLLREGAFGPFDEIPDEIAGGEIQFRFESPLSEAVEKDKGRTFLEAKAVLAEAVALDPDAALEMDFSTTLRDVLEGIGAPAKWLRAPEEVAAAKEARSQQAQSAELLAGLEQSAGAAQKLGAAAQGFARAEAA